MRLKTYSAATTAEAMELVRRELGEDAIIVSTHPDADGQGARVTAALEEPDTEDTALTGLAGDDQTGSPDADVGWTLAFHGLPGPLAQRLERAAALMTDEDTVLTLASTLDAVFSFAPLAGPASGRPVLLVGPPGTGKTIITAKLAARSALADEQPALITTDTRRAGGIEQLDAFAQILGIELMTAASPVELAKATRSVAGRPTFIDTAGTNPYSDADLEALGALVRAADGEPVLVMAAGVDALEAAETAVRFAAVGVRRMIATRLDAARRLGSLLAAADAAQLSFAEVSVDPHVGHGLSPINPVSLARLLLPGTSTSRTPPHVSEAAQ